MRRIINLIIKLVVFFAILGVASWTAIPSTRLIEITEPTATPTGSQSFAFVEISKPTYTLPPPTATVTPTPSPVPTQSPTSTPTSQPAIQAVIVDLPTTKSYAQPFAGVGAYAGNKYILVDISEQHMYIYEGDVLVYSFVSSTGMNNATRTGVFSVLDKIPSAYGASWEIWMPNWLGIYWAGSIENGIHALPILPDGSQLWAGYLGSPVSYGCVVLGPYESQLLYEWAEIGTPVEIHR